MRTPSGQRPAPPLSPDSVPLDIAEAVPPQVPDPCTMVLFGATGDLTRRKLLPAIYSLYVQGLLPREFHIVAVARRERTPEQYRQEALECVHAYAPAVPVNRLAWNHFAERIHYVTSPLQSPEDLKPVALRLGTLETASRAPGNRLYYLATPPEAFRRVVDLLAENDMLRQPPSGVPWRRLVIEKPFGHDLASARDLNQRLRSVLSESQIYRIDHYLGKETVQNIMVMRFANRLFELLWNHLYVDNV